MGRRPKFQQLELGATIQPHGERRSLSAFSSDAKQGFERIAFPLCGALALLGTGVAAFVPSHRVEALSFLIGTAVLSFIVLRFSSSRVACFLAAASATVVAGFDIWLRGATSPLVAITLVLTVLSSAFFWERQVPPFYGLAAALLVVVMQMGVLDEGWRTALSPSTLKAQWQAGELLVPLALLVVGLSAFFLPPRFPSRAAVPPAAEPDRSGRPSAQLIEGLPHAVAVFDRHSRLIAANSFWRRLHSATPDDPSGEHSGTLELHERGSDAFRRCLLGEDVSDRRTLLLKPDGAREWISTSMSPWYEEGAEVVIGGVVITKTNVTSQVELENEIENISSQLSLADAAAVAVANKPTSLLPASDSAIESVPPGDPHEGLSGQAHDNQAAADQSDGDREAGSIADSEGRELLDPSDCVPTGDKAVSLESAPASHASLIPPTSHAPPDQRSTAHGSAAQDPKGRASETPASADSLSESHQLEDPTSEEGVSEDRATNGRIPEHQAALDDLIGQYLRVFPEVLFVLDSKAQVTEVHAADESQGNLAGMDLVGTEISMAFPSLYDATRPSALKTLRDSDDVRVEEFEIPTGTRGVPIRYQARMAALHNGGFVLLNRELPGTVGSPAKVESNADEGPSFVSAAAHDLQAPLRQVSSYLELLERKHAGKLDESGRELLEFASEGSRRMKTILAGLLDFARAGQSPVAHESIHLQEALAEALAGLDHEIDEAGAHVFTSEMPRAEADLQDISLVFQNLLVNSLNYRSEHHPEIEIEASQSNGLVQIEVTDNGIGIPPDQVGDVFEAFRRLHSDAEIEGNGLGLAICKRLVERHGGTIWIEPHEGVGTRVAFTLPASDPA